MDLRNEDKVSLRKGLVEHPFGTIKRAMGAGYFLTTGMQQVSAEMSLSVLAYNMKRVLNIMGIEKLMEEVQLVGKSSAYSWTYLWLLCQKIVYRKDFAKQFATN
ncbi:MAG TPA: transposase [Gracilimonas sp.]|nr:transposase [Gracilimonas sp.]